MQGRSGCWNRRLPKAILRVLLAVFYAFAGYMHLYSPEGFLAITPDWVPFPDEVVALTGIAEILGAIGLLVPRTMIRWARPAAGIGLALYAVCVWPANFNHALNNIPMGGETQSWWYHGPRLAFQPVFIWAALWASEVIHWPFARKP
jgi:uncharacterized membrane protein